MLLEQDFPRIQVFNEIYTVQVKNTLQTNIACLDTSGVSGNSRSRTFPRMYASDSLSRISGMDFFIPFPFPNFGNEFFSFPSRSRISGMDFFHSLPVPEFWEWIFFIPFPFPNFGNRFFPFPSRSRIDPFKVRNQKGKWEILD